MKTISLFFTKYKFLLLVLLLASFSIANLFQSGLLPTHDGEYHVIRFYEFDKALRSGSWYPVWAEDLNYTYGVPLFNYVYPLPNYVASFLHATGLSFIDSFKASLIIATLLSAVTAYLLGKEKYGNWGGLITSVFYTFAPYHLLDIYVRGTIGEVWALAFFPLGLLLLDRLVKKRTIRNVIYFGLCYSLIIFSHNILAVMFSAFAGSYALLLILQSKKRIYSAAGIGSGFFLGFLLSAAFFLPALLEQKYVVGLKIYDVTTNFPELYELLIPSWGSGFAAAGTGPQMSFQIGLMNLLVVFTVLIGLIIKKITKDRAFIIFLLGWFFLLCFLMTAYSIQIWNIMPFMNYFQFPWRLLSLVILITSLLAGSVTLLTKRRIVYIVLIVLTIFSTYSYAHAPYFMQRSDSYYMSRENFIYSTNSIGNVFQTKWLSFQKKLPKSASNHSQDIRLTSKNSITQDYKVTLKKSTFVTFNTAYFPGWEAQINKKAVPISNSKGKIGIRLPAGTYELELLFTNTTIRTVSQTVSVIAFLVVLTVLFKTVVLQYFNASRH